MRERIILTNKGKRQNNACLFTYKTRSHLTRLEVKHGALHTPNQKSKHITRRETETDRQTDAKSIHAIYHANYFRGGKTIF